MQINTNQFTITTNKFKKTPSQPDRKLSIKMGEEFVEIGVAWIKEAKTGSGAKYLSVKLAEGLNVTGTVTPYQKKTTQNNQVMDIPFDQMHKDVPIIIQQQMIWIGQPRYLIMKEPLEKRSWCELLDNYRISGQIDIELFQRCDEQQLWLLGEIKKAMTRIKNK